MKIACSVMKCCAAICTGLIFAAIAPAWAQEEDRVPPATTPFAPSDNSPVADSDRMTPPPPVTGQQYPVVLGSQERSNYLRGGVVFMTAYADNALGSVGGTPLSDVSYSVAPFLSIDETTTREHLVVSYAPGYTFYQRFSSLNQANQNASIRFAYRLSPNVTFSVSDAFQKTNDIFNQPLSQTGGAVNTGPEIPNFSVIAPIADQLNNVGNVGLTYQFALNDMIGANGTFTNLHYPNPTQVPGLFDSNSQAGLAFWAHRISRKQYFGLTYQYQRLLAYPIGFASETQTHAPLFFYSAFPAKQVTLSFFGGPQYSSTVQPAPALPLKQWTAAGGTSLSWQGHLTAVAVSYAHIISSSAGLISASRLDTATVSLSQQIIRNLSAAVSGGYTQNDILGTFNPSLGLTSGHSISGNASLQQQFGRNLTLQLGYMHLRQDYSGVPILALTPNTNREFVSLSYHFDKALGR
jgi:hypothetical protein